MTVTPDLSEFMAIANDHPTTCVVARSRAQLQRRDRVNFDAALTRKDDEGNWVVGNDTIGKWLKDKGLPGRGGAVKKHREGGCCCVQV